MENSTRYIGIYNYVGPVKLPLTKMLAFSNDINEVIGACIDHYELNGTSYDDYHISTYEGNWNNENTASIPTKTKQNSLYELQ